MCTSVWVSSLPCLRQFSQHFAFKDSKNRGEDYKIKQIKRTCLFEVEKFAIHRTVTKITAGLYFHYNAWCQSSHLGSLWRCSVCMCTLLVQVDSINFSCGWTAWHGVHLAGREKWALLSVSKSTVAEAAQKHNTKPFTWNNSLVLIISSSLFRHTW